MDLYFLWLSKLVQLQPILASQKGDSSFRVPVADLLTQYKIYQNDWLTFLAL